MRHFDSDRGSKGLMHRHRRRCLNRDEGGLKCQVFLRMHAYPFMDEVGVEIVGRGDIGNRGVSLRTLGDDLVVVN
ncbi:hypothetical protein PSE10B_53880 [Pseudomonas amygdali pv. eriobotryae]|uniref:Uncharacterized protein n=2 Tax=Pseudomonas amygdali pv. eriobotryae TaxID=129137 RepID=A0A9P3AJC9_PSEA0|nr:hypothetical protein PSE10A_53470 [Pseudomonas amygdali pv. eriobotryae]GFZ68866.1 hypothetical protein PSE10B_53880 [Pseudomonas amygdali pv. eriobotryae]